MKLTENGVVTEFLQECGCSESGPSKKCSEGRKVYREYAKANKALLEGKITLEFADISLGKWQEHLGA